MTNDLNGFLLLDKEEGITSHGLVLKARKKLNIKKIGHAGTLDPFASGLMILGIGKGTRLLEFLLKQDKVYLCTMKLGIITDTYDLEGEIKEKRETDNITEEQIKFAFESFKGNYFQVPPAYSAKKYNGERLYKLAREGKIINLPPKEVQIKQLVIKNIDLEKKRITFLTEVSSGTYIRSLVMDIGYKIGCGAVTENLRRTRIGKYKLENSIKSDNINTESIISIDNFSSFLPGIVIKNEDVKLIRNGAQIFCNFINSIEKPFKKNDNIRIMNENERLIAVATAERSSKFINTLIKKESRERVAKLKKVFI